MNTSIDDQLLALRARLITSAAADLRRSARRRRTLALTPVVLSVGTGGAFAVAPLLGSPAPATIEHQFDEDRTAVGADIPDPALRAVARADGHTLYAGETAAGACMVVDQPAAVTGGRATDGFACLPDTELANQDIWFSHLGGGSTPNDNLVTGRVMTPARTVTVELSNGSEVVADVGLDGYFIAALPDSVLNSARAPVVSGVARDADGKVVARMTL